MAHGVSRCIESQQLDGSTHSNDVAGIEPTVHTLDAALRVLVREHFGTGRFDKAFISTNMIEVFMGVQYLRDVPALVFRDRQAQRVVIWVDCHRLASFGADDQVVKVAKIVPGPDLLNDH